MKTKKYILKAMAAFLFGITIISCSKENSETEINDEKLNGNDTVDLINYNAVFVVNGESNSISVINLETNKVERTIDLSSLENKNGNSMNMGMDNLWPHHINISPDKSKLAIAAPGMDLSMGHSMMPDTSGNNPLPDGHSEHHGGSSSGTIPETQMQGRILILDATSGDLTKEIIIDGMAHNAIFSPDGKELWTALMMPEGKVKVFDANSYTLLNSIRVGNIPAEVTFSEDGTKAYVANGMSNNITVIDAATKQVIDSVVVEENPVGAWPGMGGMMYVDNKDGMSICMINSMTNMMNDTLQLGFIPGMVAANKGMNQMWVTDPENGKVHYWTKSETGYIHGGFIVVGNGAHAMAFTKNGKMCYVTNQNEGNVSVLDIESGTELYKINVGVKPTGIIIRYK